MKPSEYTLEAIRRDQELAAFYSKHAIEALENGKPRQAIIYQQVACNFYRTSRQLMEVEN